MEVSQNGWCVMENPFKVNDLGVPPCQETDTCQLMMNWLQNREIVTGFRNEKSDHLVIEEWQFEVPH